MELKEVKKLKLNARNIRSTIFRGNNKLKKLRLKETNLLTRERDRKKKKRKENRVEGKGSLSNIGGVKKKIASKSKSIFDKIMEFFGLIAGGILISTLPAIIKSIRQFFIDHKELIDGIKEFFRVIGDAIKGFVAMFDSSPLNKDQLENDREELSGKIDEIKGSNGIGLLKKKADELEILAGDKEKEIKERTESDQQLAQQYFNKKDGEGNPAGVNLSKETGRMVTEEVNMERSDGDGATTAINPRREDYSNTRSGANQYMVAKRAYESSLVSGNQNENQKVQNLAKGGTVGVWNSSLGINDRVRGTVTEFKTFRDNQVLSGDIVDIHLKANNTFKSIADDLARLNLSTESNQKGNSKKIKMFPSLLTTPPPIERSVNQANNQSNILQKEPSNGKIIEYITGDRSHSNYREDHGGNNYHEHLAFSSTEERDRAAEALRSSGFVLGSFNDGTHANSSYHYSNQAFDVPLGPNLGRYEDSREGEEQFSRDVREALRSSGFGGSGINIKRSNTSSLQSNSSMISSKEFNVSKIQRASNISTEIDEESQVLVLNRTEIIPFVVST